MRGREYPGLFRPSVITQSVRREKGRQESGKGDVAMGAEVRVLWGQEPRNVRTASPSLLEKARTQSLP